MDIFNSETYSPRPIKLEHYDEYSLGEYIDRSGLFADFNFKLIVIEALLDKSPFFYDELMSLNEKCSNIFKWYEGAPPIHELLLYLSELSLTSEELSQVSELVIDGGLNIYGMIKPDWDGEDELFDLTSIMGFEHIPNLHTIYDIGGLCERGVLLSAERKGIIIKN